MAVEIVNAAAVPDRRKANKAEVAEWFGVSVPTVDAWIRRGCPHLQRGNRGLSWIFDIKAVAEWYYGASDSPEDDPEKMSPKDRLDWYRGARERTKHLQELGELVSVSDYEKTLSSALKKVAIALETMPDQIEREAPISGEAIEVIQRITDRVRETVYRGLSEEG
jgi:terminase small subunit / prophage DNA-packing protein